ncbi:MAG: hypothetical protein AMS22_18050 [Thiotrichales bacterium SG8_50]|nr:MAG: hypothetical protein AMS22_18050 [Thiotrichales bacterium SG8_50]
MTHPRRFAGLDVHQADQRCLPPDVTACHALTAEGPAIALLFFRRTPVAPDTGDVCGPGAGIGALQSAPTTATEGKLLHHGK